MANADQYGSFVAAVCLIISCIMTQQFNCDRSYTWELLIICTVFASVVALSTVIDLSVIMSGTIGYVVNILYIMFAGAFAWDILYVKFNKVCTSNTFFDAHMKYMILYLLEIIGLAAMVRVHTGGGGR